MIIISASAWKRRVQGLLITRKKNGKDIALEYVLFFFYEGQILRHAMMVVNTMVNLRILFKRYILLTELLIR